MATNGDVAMNGEGETEKKPVEQIDQVCMLWLMGLCHRKEEDCKYKHERDLAPVDDQTMMHLAEQPSFCCNICDVEMHNCDEAEKHSLTPEHTEALAKAVEEKSEKWCCKMCSVSFPPGTLHRFQWLHNYGTKAKMLRDPGLRTCVLCDVNFTKTNAKYHLQSPLHEGFLKASLFHCATCEMYFMTNDHYFKHMEGKKHATMVNFLPVVDDFLLNSEDMMNGAQNTPSEIAKLLKEGEKKIKNEPKKPKKEVKTYTCEFCANVNVKAEEHWQAHINGKKHLKNIKKSGKEFCHCVTCDVTLEKEVYDAHMVGRNHAKKLRATQAENGTVENIKVEPMLLSQPVVEGDIYCHACEVTLNTNNADPHFKGKKHQKVMNKMENQLLCDICNINPETAAMYVAHVGCQSHQQNLVATKRDQFSRSRKCVPCSKEFTLEVTYGDHIVSEEHKGVVKSISDAEGKIPNKKRGHPFKFGGVANKVPKVEDPAADPNLSNNERNWYMQQMNDMASQVEHFKSLVQGGPK